MRPVKGEARFKQQSGAGVQYGNKVNYGSYTDDLNNIPVRINVQTVYRVVPNCKNSPAPGEHGVLRTMYVDSSRYAIQDFLSIATTKLFVRSKINDNWSNWVEK